MMQQVKTMLENIISKAKEVLRIDPENTAARKAQRLAEAEKRALQEEYFAHAEKAMDTCVLQKPVKTKTPQPSRPRTRRKNWGRGLKLTGISQRMWMQLTWELPGRNGFG